MAQCDCGCSSWRPEHEDWLFHDSMNDQEIILRVRQICPTCGCLLERGITGPSRVNLEIAAKLLFTLREWHGLQRAYDVKEMWDVVLGLIGASNLALAGYDSARSLLGRLPTTDCVVQPLRRAKRILQDRHEATGSPPPEEPKPKHEAVNCPGCGNIAIPAPLGVSSEGNWPYVCEQCGRHFVVDAEGERI